MPRMLFFVVLVCTSVLAKDSFTVTSPSYKNGAENPIKFSQTTGNCHGQNYSPQLAWKGAPKGTKSYAIFMTDTRIADFVHRAAYNIPASTTKLEPSIKGQKSESLSPMILAITTMTARAPREPTNIKSPFTH